MKVKIVKTKGRREGMKSRKIIARTFIVSYIFSAHELAFKVNKTRAPSIIRPKILPFMTRHLRHKNIISEWGKKGNLKSKDEGIYPKVSFQGECNKNHSNGR